MSKYTSILIDPDTRERLKSVGRKGQTYSELIDELLKLRAVKTQKEIASN